MSDYPLIEIESDLADALALLGSAVDEIEGGDEMPEEAFRAYLKACGLANLYEVLTSARKSIKEAWDAPDLQGRLKQEWAEYDDMADRAEAQMY